MPQLVFVNRAFHTVGGQWLGFTSPRPTPKHFLAPRTPVHEDGARDRGSPLGLNEVRQWCVGLLALTRPTYL